MLEGDPARGTIKVSGTKVTDLRGASLAAYRRSVGFVFQRFHLIDELTALNNVIAAAGYVASLGTVGIGARAWPLLFPEADIPEGLTAFEAMSDGDRSFPSTPGDLFVMVKSSRIDLALEVGKYLILGFAPIADCVEDQRGFKYLDDRDLIYFVDGTENPRGTERVAAVLVPSGTYAGGTHLLIQTYLDRQAEWNALTIEDQEGVIGRTKFDDIEIPDAEKKPFAYNVKSKVEIDGTEIKMFRQNRAIGTAKEHGTMFVGFAAEASTLTTSLRQMITADADGNYDHLLDFVTATTGAMYFVPPQAFLDAITD